MILASVVVPAYNSVDHLSRCIDSILMQSEKSIEVIVVNDGSTDGTLEMAQRYAVHDDRVKVLTQDNSGVSAARNKGMSRAQGEYLFFMDSDDWMEPHTIEEMVEQAKRLDAEVVIAGYIRDYLDAQNELVHSEMRGKGDFIIDKNEKLPTEAFNEDFWDLIGYPWNKIYKREWLSSLGEFYDESLSLSEDADFNVRVLSQASRVAVISSSYVHYIQRPQASLIMRRELDFVPSSLRLVKNIYFIMGEWGVDLDQRVDRASRTAGNALWSLLDAATNSSHPEKRLKEFLSAPGGKDLCTIAAYSYSHKGRGTFATFVIKNNLHVFGLLVLSALQPIKRFRVQLRKTRGMLVSIFS